MRTNRFGRLFDGAAEGLLLACIAAILIGTVLTTREIQADTDAHVVTIASSLLAGGFLLLAGLASYVMWRSTPEPRQGWVVAGTVVIAGQVLINAGFGLDSRGDDPQAGWPLVVEALMITTVAGLCWVGLRSRAARMPDPLAIGLAIVLVAAGLRLLVTPWDTMALAPAVGVLLALAVVAGHVGVGLLVLGNSRLPRWCRWRFAITVTLLGVGHAALLGPTGGSRLEVVSALAMAVAGITWASATFVLLRDSVEAQRRRAASLEGSLLETETTARGARERLHEVKATIAGLASASQLLSDDTLPPDVRRRLETSIRTELARLERLVGMRPSETGTVAVDDVVGSVLALHRAQGRVIEWEPTGARAVGSTDAVAEAINILLENSARHGGNSGSRVAVESGSDDVVLIRVSDEGPGIPPDLRDHVFDWGVGRPDSPGQGIGLNLAQRLMTEHGGSLTLEDRPTTGSSFVIHLPAARQSQEYDDDTAQR